MKSLTNGGVTSGSRPLFSLIRCAADGRRGAQARLGHSDPHLTLAVYAQATTEADWEAAKRLGAHFLGSPADVTRDGRAMPNGRSREDPA